MSAAVKYLRDCVEGIDRAVQRAKVERAELYERAGRVGHSIDEYAAERAELVAAIDALTPVDGHDLPF